MESYSAQMVPVNWTEEFSDIQIQIRLSQIDAAIALNYWNEAFKVSEDIHTIIEISKNILNKYPKVQLMLKYYDKLAQIFWQSEDILYHACALFRYYTLQCENKKDFDKDEKCLLATRVLLAVLCVPCEVLTTESFNEEVPAAATNQIFAMLGDRDSNLTRKTLLASRYSNILII